jgi:entry exclusion lipoprotein TrbK
MTRTKRLALTALVAAALTGCGKWVDISKDGCDPADIEKMNESQVISGTIGIGACALHGAGEFKGEFRCDGDTLQVKCSG